MPMATGGERPPVSAIDELFTIAEGQLSIVTGAEFG